MLSNIYAIQILTPNQKETKMIEAKKINTRNRALGGDRQEDEC
jgi:hypothetical protein